MATTGIHTGHIMRLYIDATAVANATNCTMSLAMSPRTISHKDTSGTAGGWEEKLGGKKSGTVSSDYLREEGDSSTALFTAFAAGTAVTWLYSSQVSGDKSWTGSGFITAYDQAAPDEENATGSITIETSGAVTEATVV